MTHITSASLGANLLLLADFEGLLPAAATPDAGLDGDRLSVDGRSYRVRPDLDGGFLELPADAAAGRLWYGWSADPRTGAPAEQVLLLGRTAVLLTPWSPRPDVARHLGGVRGYLSGFIVPPLLSFALGASQVSGFGLFSDGEAAPLSVQAAAPASDHADLPC